MLPVCKPGQRIEIGKALQGIVTVADFRDHLVERGNEFTGFIVGLVVYLCVVLTRILDLAHGLYERKNGRRNAALQGNGDRGAKEAG